MIENSIMPIIALAGVLDLAICSGAQSLVKDVLRGVFMLTEDQFSVGDRSDLRRVKQLRRTTRSHGGDHGRKPTS